MAGAGHTDRREGIMSVTSTVRPSAGKAAELRVAEAGHGGFMGTAPEDEEIIREVRRVWTTTPTAFP